MTPDPEVRQRFVIDFTKLSLWYVRQLLERGEIAESKISEALSRRVDIYRMTALWDEIHDPALGYSDPEWTRVTTDLVPLIRNSPGHDTSAMESQALERLWSLLEKRIPKDIGPPSNGPFGCWTYELAWEGIGDRPGTLGKLLNPVHVLQRVRKALGIRLAPHRDVALHFHNAVMPLSPWDDMPALAQSLRALIAACRRLHPSVQRFWCGTWLNSHPTFRLLFPPAWHGNAKIQQPGNFRNWWGQFSVRTGDFNHRLGKLFRESGGQFPYTALMAHATIDEIDTHLEAEFPLIQTTTMREECSD